MAGELWRRSAAEIATLIARGEVSSSEAVEAHIARIVQVNPALNALTCERFEAARAEARTADERRASDGADTLGPLHGVPITVKESLDVAGLPTTLGVPSRARLVSEYDGPYVARMRAAGAVVLGKTNVSQLMIFIESDNPLYGRSNNPWDLQRTPGGSSGGQAALIAAGGSALGLGTDIGGSIRVPATFCGIAGLKPTAGRFPERTTPEIFGGETAIESQAGLLARDVEDIALGLEVLGRGGDDEYAQAPPLRAPYSVDPGSLRVGAYVQAGSFAPAPAVARAVEEAAGALARAGVQVVPFEPPDPDLSLALFYRILAANAGRSAIAFLGDDPRDPRVDDLLSIASKPRPAVELIVRALRALGQKGTADLADVHGFHSAADYWQAVAGQQAYRQRFRAAMDAAEGGPLDALIAPACALPALRHGASRAVGTAGPYATLYNLLGYPAGVVPFTRVGQGEAAGRMPSRDQVENAAYKTEMGSEGLPIGVQVVARPWREDVVLVIMDALESAARERREYPRTPIETF
jgi:fatty acid amide hydrolase